VFKERFFHTLDENSRIAIPSKWRKTTILPGVSNLIVTQGLDSNLWMFTEEDWKKYIDARIEELPVGDDTARGFIKFFVSPAAECLVDKSGRIILPQHLTEYASLKKDIVLTGAGFFMEIWSREIWDRYFSDNQEKLKDFAKTFFSMPLKKEDK
jgi:MraZ protein